MKRPGNKNFNAVSHNRLWPEVLFLNLTWQSRGQISSVLLQLLLFAFSNSKFGRHGKWSVTFWQWENNAYDRTWLWDTALKFSGRAFSNVTSPDHLERHNLLAYMMNICQILSLQCIIGRFSAIAVSGCFVSVERLCSRVLVYISRSKSKTEPEWQLFSV